MDHVDEASIVAENIKDYKQQEIQAAFLHALLAINESLSLIAASMHPGAGRSYDFNIDEHK